MSAEVDGMDVQHLIDGARDTLSVRRVFGDPYAQNGVTVIPVAKVQGGVGGGEGEEGEGGRGSGGGLGLTARPAGMFVITGDKVRWQPAVDVNRIIAGAQVVAVAALLTVRSIINARLRAELAR